MKYLLITFLTLNLLNAKVSTIDMVDRYSEQKDVTIYGAVDNLLLDESSPLRKGITKSMINEVRECINLAGINSNEIYSNINDIDRYIVADCTIGVITEVDSVITQIELFGIH